MVMSKKWTVESYIYLFNIDIIYIYVLHIDPRILFAPLTNFYSLMFVFLKIVILFQLSALLSVKFSHHIN